MLSVVEVSMTIFGVMPFAAKISSQIARLVDDLYISVKGSSERSLRSRQASGSPGGAAFFAKGWDFGSIMTISSGQIWMYSSFF